MKLMPNQRNKVYECSRERMRERDRRDMKKVEEVEANINNNESMW